MKIGLFTIALSNLDLESVFIFLKRVGVHAVELASHYNITDAHISLKDLLSSDQKISDLQALLREYDMEISALSCHGNPVHPQKEVAALNHEDFIKTVLLAEKLGVKRVITFSGCPGDHNGAKYPNWVTCAWPEDYPKILDYQWNEVLLPYWEKAAAFASDHGVLICIEMHPGFCVYNPETLLKLRGHAGPAIGANFDPSHLFWQGIDAVSAIRRLGSAIYHFHAKDVKIDDINCRVHGVLDTKHYSDELHRSWIFRTVGYGHGMQVWRDIMSELVIAGYDHVLSIEHEDSLMSSEEGLRKAVVFLQQAMNG